ncbi:MAG: glycosyltransferase [Deltaproteobacteria bacterium]|nr:glycosyltransferase [Deltaproteobacteria bacterium]
MHIALVTSSFPDPPETAGRIRAGKLARALARHGRVVLFSALRPEDREAETRRAGKGLEPFARVVTHPLQDARRGSGGEGPAECRRFPDALVRALAAAHEVHPFDVVVLASVLASRALGSIQRAPVVLDVPRIEWVARERDVRRSAGWLPRGLLELHRWRKFEHETWRRVDALTAARVADLPLIHAYRPDTGVHVSNGIDTGLHIFKPPSQRKGNTVLFSGPLWYEPNVQSVVTLATEVMPELRKRVPDATLTIAGKGADSRVTSLESDSVRLVGNMTSILALFADHAAFAVPPVAGRCPETRLLDAFSSGMPVVTSVEALPDPVAIPGRHFVHGHTPVDLAEGLARVFERRDQFDKMAALGNRMASRYDWELIGEGFARVVLGAAERRRV